MSRVTFQSSAVAVMTLSLAACSSSQQAASTYAPLAALSSVSGAVEEPGRRANRVALNSSIDHSAAYAAVQDGDVFVEAFDYTKMNPRHLRRRVRYYGDETPGTIVIDAGKRFLYLVENGGTAMRYGIAVGKEGYGWTGNARMQWKQEWPTWTPPAEMIARNPKYQKYADGLAGSPENPLGARAMYLFKGGKDTLYRIHGTDKPFSIGKAASSGCFRMINQDVMDLYSRVSGKPKVYVRQAVTAQQAMNAQR